MTEACDPSQSPRDLAGCVFSVHPMTDNYINEIMGALDTVDFSQLGRHTDHVFTVDR